MKTEYQYRLRQAQDLGQKIARAHLTQPETTLTLHSRWLSIIGFYLPITCFTQQQCKQTRRLALENPRVVERWCKLQLMFISIYNMLERVFNLQQQIDAGKWNLSLVKEYEKL